MKKIIIFLSIILLLQLANGNAFACYGNDTNNNNNNTNNNQSDNATNMTYYTNTNQITTPITMKQASLAFLLKQHILEESYWLMARYDQNPAFSDLQNQMNDNTQQLNNFMGNAFGQDAQNQFNQFWQNRNNLLLQYADATKANDQNQKQQIQQNLNNSANDMANFFANRNNMVPQNELQNIFQNYTNQQEALIDAHAAGDTNQVNTILMQMNGYADTMANKIMSTANNNQYYQGQNNAYNGNGQNQNQTQNQYDNQNQQDQSGNNYNQQQY